MARSPPLPRPKIVIVKGKTKRTTGILTIGNKMLQKRKINLAERNDIRLRQEAYIPIIRDPKLDSAAVRSRTFAKKSKVRGTHRRRLTDLTDQSAPEKLPRSRPGTNRIYKSKRSNKISVDVQKTRPQRSISHGTPSSLRLSISTSSILKKLVVPIRIKIAYNAELETMIRNRQSEVANFNKTDASGANFSASHSISENKSDDDETEEQETKSESELPERDAFKAAAEFIRKALNANANGAGTGPTKAPEPEA